MGPAVVVWIAGGLAKGATNPGKEQAGVLTQEQLTAIAETKMPDLNAIDIEGAMRIVEGTARSMGITVAS